MHREIAELKNAIRDVPDFPKKGILFKDITTLLEKGDLFRKLIDQIASHYLNAGIKKVVGIESRGFIIGAPIAYKLGAGFVLIRKKGKLPYRTVSYTYSLEYGTDTIEMHDDAIIPGEKVLVVDDLLATGGTAAAAMELLKKCGAKAAGLACIIELSFLEGRKNLKDHEIFSLIQY